MADLNNLRDIYGAANVWDVGEAPSDIAGRDWLLNRNLESEYGPQYGDKSLSSRWASWASADQSGGGGTFAGIQPYSGNVSTAQRSSGGRSSAYMGGTSGGSGGMTSGSYYIPNKEGKEDLAAFMKKIESRGDPTFGELPDLNLGKFKMPEIDESKIALLTEQAGAQDRGQLRNEVLRRIMSQANSIQNPTQRKNFIREALAGYSAGLGDIQKAAGQEGRSTYQNLYYNPAVQEAATNYQTNINKQMAKYNAKLGQLAAEYNFAGNKALAGDNMLYNYYTRMAS